MKETLQSVVAQSTAAGLLQDGNGELALLLQSKSKDELRALAKTRSLSQSGTKETIARRLVTADPTGMGEIFCGKDYLICTPKGELIVDRFIEAEELLRVKAELASQSALKTRQYADAFAIVGQFEASRPFPRSTDCDSTHDLDVLNEIGTVRLKQCATTSDSTVMSLRVAAGMMYLWGTNKPEKWLTDSDKKFANQAMVILSAATAKVRLREMKRTGIKRVEMLSSGRDDMCVVCRKDDRTIYDISSAPELPHEDCTCEFGCACMLIAAK
jgi:hypothetical protein